MRATPAGEPAGLEHLAPAGSDGESPRRSAVDVAVKVVPALHGPLVTQASVELDDGGLPRVDNVSEGATGTRIPSLPLPAGQAMGAFDVVEVAPLEC